MHRLSVLVLVLALVIVWMIPVLDINPVDGPSVKCAPMQGVLAPNDELSKKASRIGSALRGPETVIFDRNGRMLVRTATVVSTLDALPCIRSQLSELRPRTLLGLNVCTGVHE